jgi:tRNA A-37 threonylcarbamoyl transferase component Bud32
VDETRVDPGSFDLGQGSQAAGSLAGSTLCGRYHLERLIGSGGMAQVWEATDAVLGRRVAVKVLHPHLAVDDAFVRRFRQEAIAAARLNNPGIVGVYDTCSDGGREAIVMELLDASTLRQLLDERGALDADTTLRIGLRLLDALEAAHRAGLVHRDVKPSNILLCSDGRLKIADFGIAKADDQTELTREGSLLGTASYLAPEQLTGQPVDARADLYSLGLVLYECLTGRVPFEGDTGAAVALARLHTQPADPRRLRADVPPRLADAVMRALAREPDDRFASAAAFRAALLDTGLPTAAPPPAAEPPGEEPLPAEPSSFGRSERRWLVPALVILLVGTAVTVAGLLLRESTQPSDAPTTTVATGGGGANPGAAAALPVDHMATFDPQGKGQAGENDDIAGRAADGKRDTAWQTESYDQPDFFGAKRGVGLVAVLPQRSTFTSVRIDGSTNGWSASVYVVDATTLDGFDPARAKPTARVSDVRGQVDVDLGGATGSIVLVWITNLGDAGDGGRHRVDIAELQPIGVPAPG